MQDKKQILGASCAEALFSAPDKLREEFVILIKVWHPDRNKDVDAETVAQKIQKLYEEGKEKASRGVWNKPGELNLEVPNGKKILYKYKKHHLLENGALGDMYYGRTNVLFLIKNDYADLFESGRRMIRGLTYRDSKMEIAFCDFLPQIKKTFETTDGRIGMVLAKEPGSYLLRDVHNAYGGHMPVKHMAWVLSRMHNINCYLEWAKLTHNAQSMDTIFISPANHTAMLLGGWWYATPEGARLNALPARTMRYVPPLVLKEKKATPRIDLAMTKILGKELLGDSTGTNFPTDVPDKVRDFLQYPSTQSAQKDYAGWYKALEDSFGARRFTKMSIGDSDIFKEIP